MKARFFCQLISVALVVVLGFPNQKAQSSLQNDCPKFVQSVMDAVQSVCADTKRDQICYGNVSVAAAPVNDSANFNFSKEGDLADLQDVGSVKLKTLDINSDEWGVTLLKIKTSLPDDSSENVKMLLFGNIEIDNKGSNLMNLPMTVSFPANVRVRPAANGPLLGSLPSGSEVVANGQLTNAAGEEWIRIQFKGAPGDVGWVMSSAVTTEGDVKTLAKVQSSAEKAFGPMQAFTFKSKAKDAPCAQAPDSGMVIQTPKGKGQISFLINEVNVRLGSTVFFQAVPGEDMRIRTLEGHGVVLSEGKTRILPPGSELIVPLNENGVADGVPSEPEAYDGEEMQLLSIPLSVKLFDRDITIIDPIDVAYLSAFNKYFNSDDSKFFDGGNDAVFEDFFTSYFEDGFFNKSDDFDHDITTALVDYLSSGDLPAQYRHEFEQTVFNSFTSKQQTEFFDTLNQNGDPALVEQINQDYQKNSSGDNFSMGTNPDNPPPNNEVDPTPEG